ncbi:hypothetical protein TcasGA2_TC015860 [Tribolium castaneum]|uniref:Uncharacterized protein n=1 Tax=Tribolium castaneum TaxID=7070 RepID=D2A4D1_TRICA|nr:hypothetical protein TcasGA2_TC015860 [Tribolium castaneum]
MSLKTDETPACLMDDVVCSFFNRDSLEHRQVNSAPGEAFARGVVAVLLVLVTFFGERYG